MDERFTAADHDTGNIVVPADGCACAAFYLTHALVENDPDGIKQQSHAFTADRQDTALRDGRERQIRETCSGETEQEVEENI